MKWRSLIFISLLIVLPVGALTWTVVRLADQEQLVLQQRYRQLLIDRLTDVNRTIAIQFEDLERDLVKATAIDDFDIDSLRERNRSEPRFRQLFVLTDSGGVLYPNPNDELNVSERSFLLQTSEMFTGQDLRSAVRAAEQKAKGPAVSPVNDSADQRQSDLKGAPVSGPLQQQTPTASAVGQKNDYFVLPTRQQFPESSGWFIWYWDRGLNLIFWQRRPSGNIVGCALERSRWLADLVAELPQTVAERDEPLSRIPTRIRLLNASAGSVYQWGTYEPEDNAETFCEVPVPSPLKSWRLQCFLPTSSLTAGTGGSLWTSLLVGVAGLTLALLAVAGLFLKEYHRDMKQAAQQVSFVNQVSHELRTPLTNIRMYADLLDRDLESDQVHPEDPRPRQRLEVIQSESQRLSRLISNVLTFASQQKQSLQPQGQPKPVCETVRHIVDRFRPVCLEQGIDVFVECQSSSDDGSGDVRNIDADFLEQILGNLISNVEKYASSGGILEVKTTVNHDTVIVNVMDRGPGIAVSFRDKVFLPFARVCNDVSFAAGTGIGLPIARELARLHGGDLHLLESEAGCHFQVCLKEIRSHESPDC